MTASRVMVLWDPFGDTYPLPVTLRLAALLDVNRIVTLGDLGIRPPGDSARWYLDKIQQAVEKTGVDIVIVPGDHDDFRVVQRARLDDEGMLALRPGIRVVQRGATWEQDSRTWLALGGIAGLNPSDVRGSGIGPDTNVKMDRKNAGTDGPVTAHDLARAHTTLDNVERAGGRVEVMLTDQPPLWIALKDRYLGELKPGPRDNELRQLTTDVADRARPDLLLCGHPQVHTVAAAPWGGLGVALSSDPTDTAPRSAIVEAPDNPATPVHAFAMQALQAPEQKTWIASQQTATSEQATVILRLAYSRMTREAVHAWMITPNTWLDGRTPDETLQAGDMDAVHHAIDGLFPG